MKTALSVFWRDVKRIVKNPFALGVILGMCVLPAAYAWYCIEANWDPYKLTANMHIPVVNNDAGAQVDGMGEVNVGDQIVDQLQQNDAFTWEFVSEDEAREGVESGKYYAAFIIPENFSSDLAGVLDGRTDNPKIEYFVNEKYSGTAVKVTDTGSSTIGNAVNDSFTGSVSQAMAEILKQAAGSLKSDVNARASSAGQSLSDAQAQVDDVISLIDDTSGGLDDWHDTVANAQGALDAMREALPGIEQSLSDAQSTLATVRTASSDFNTAFTGGLTDSAAALTQASSTANQKVADYRERTMSAKAQVDGALADLRTVADRNQNAIDTVQQHLDASSLPADSSVRADIENRVLAPLMARNDSLRQSIDSLQTASDNLGKSVLAVSGLITSMNDGAASGAQAMVAATKSFNVDVLPQLSSSADVVSTTLGTLSGSVAGLGPQIDQVKGLLGQVDSVIGQMQSSLSDASGTLSRVSKGLSTTVTDLSALAGSLDLSSVVDIEHLDASQVGSFMSSPLAINTQSIYPISHYAAAVAPFYTNLAIWIGCFMLVAIIKLEIDREGYEGISPSQAYLARFFLYLFVNLVQATVIVLGEIFLLGFGVADPVSLLVSAWVTSLAFVSIVYMLAISFRHIGKALAVVLLIMQIPGSSGMYPIEMMPDFFQAIHPLLPFTYGIDAMRQAIGGIYGGELVHDLVVLLLMVPAAFFVGMVLRPYFQNLNVLFDKRLAETTFMITEEHGVFEQRYRSRNVLRALYDNDQFRPKIAARAAAFEKSYRALEGIGQLIVFLLPIGVIVLMSILQVDPDPNTKVELLVLFVVSVVVVDGAIIAIEYLHEYWNGQLELVSQSQDRMEAEALNHVPLRHHDFSEGHEARVRAVLDRREARRSGREGGDRR
ncbi:YhgE/Pip domain-containing protein [Hugonella massiliensis]|uniref:YhgE/Pip domain-containing protein n=1 Tax=Hugonella massiliensis TaxID=1720315 RepID=UPI00073EE332|nr:YhgE/Pip domain-containing protein [Hugonella massiliensis]